MFVCNSLLFATLRAVCENGKMEKVLFSDVSGFENGAEFGGQSNDGYWYDDSHVEVCVAMLLNDGFLFERNGFIYPSINAHGFAEYVVGYKFEMWSDAPFLTIVKKAIKAANKNFAGDSE